MKATKLVTICKACNSLVHELTLESDVVYHCFHCLKIVETKQITLKEYNDLNF